MKRNSLIHGIGINDADYVLTKVEKVNNKQKLLWICPFYAAWKKMLERCYSEKLLARYPTYKGCRVCSEWLIFSNFKKWMETQDWKGKSLDKDLLVKGNKVYSPDTCVFVDAGINVFTTDCAKSRGKYLIGVSRHKPTNKFLARCSNPFTNKQENLGYFDDELEAHLAWKTRKHELACELANTCSDEKLAISLRNRYLVEQPKPR